jgi:Glyoxalase/Bleomycin resistance protein/Dioxygenase superfamily
MSSAWTEAGHMCEVGAMATIRRAAPIFAVRDLNTSMAHYQRMGFATRAYEGGGYGFATRDRAEIHLGVVAGTSLRAGAAYLFVDDADELAQEWTAAGLHVHEPENKEWGMNEGIVEDPDGNVIRFGSRTRLQRGHAT